MFNLLIGLSNMVDYCLKTQLVEKPSVCLYYKGMESNSTISFALNVIVAFTPADALLFDEKAARVLCDRLNKDKRTLLAHGYTEFTITKITNS